MDGRTSTSVFESPASGAATPEARSGARQPANSPATPDATHGRLTIDPARLAAWLQSHLPELGGAALHVRALDGGQSNPSWVLQAADRRWVLRAKPGPAAELPRSAHAIEREFEVMSVLRLAGFPVAPVRVLCEDESVIGAAFYVMDFLAGRVLRDGALPELPVAERAAYHWEANRVLARLHQLDWAQLGLQGYGRAGGYFERTVRRWSQQYRAAAAVTGEIPPMERLADWLPGHIPAGADEPACTRLTHGDFRMENLMFHPERPEVVAVMDWELSTLGHPLSDLAYCCTAWHLPPGLLRGLGERVDGVPSERAFVQRYCEQAGLAPEDVLAHWPLYMAFSLFRISAILAGIGVRARQGNAANARASDIAALAEPVAEMAWRIASGQQPPLRV